MAKNRKLLNIELGRISAQEYRIAPESGVVVVLDNVRSAHNVGSAFRSCDSFKVDKICLCGICAVPPSAEIHKSALGAEDSVPWQHFDNTLDAVSLLKGQGYTIVSVEQAERSVPLENFKPWANRAVDDNVAPEVASQPIAPAKKYALIFGNEVSGISQDVVDASDFAIEIPQFGTKHSLNVSVSVGIVLWHFCPYIHSSLY